jgi:hypothetical protein
MAGCFHMPIDSKKNPDVYSVTEGGLDIPVIDVTNPAFAVEATPAELAGQFARFGRQLKANGRIPRWIRSFLFKRALRGSQLGSGITAASGGFLDGISTYLLKLGPKNMGAGFTEIDRAIAADLPATALRLRLRDVADLLAEGVADPLGRNPARSLHLLNIGGGVSIDSINALILLQRDRPELLAGRDIRIDVLDLRPEGAGLGARACRALQVPGAPLCGLDITFTHLPYDWTKPQDLMRLTPHLREDPVVALSSEGALFEYGSDTDIVANLQVVARRTPDDSIVVGSVARNNDDVRRLHALTGAQVKLRGIDAFRLLVDKSGWRLNRTRAGLISDQASLRKP